MSRSKYSLLRCTYSKGVGMNQREKDNCYGEKIDSDFKRK